MQQLGMKSTPIEQMPRRTIIDCFRQKLELDPKHPIYIKTVFGVRYKIENTGQEQSPVKAI